MKLNHQFTYLLLIGMKRILSSMKAQSRYKLAVSITNIACHYFPFRKAVAKMNLHQAFPSLSEKRILQILKKTYLFFIHNFIEFIAIPKSWESIKISVKGEHLLASCLNENKGVVSVTGHFGAWEILGKWLGEYANLFTGVALHQKNKGFEKFTLEQRSIPGTKQIFKKEPLEKMYEVLSQNGLLGLISDQDAKKKGVFVDFFGKPASTPKGAALFHINTSAPMMLGVCIKRNLDEYEIRLIPVDTSTQNITLITQNYTTMLEKIIKEHPEQYFWFHRRWKTRP